jgi:hypothetical protein
MFGAVLVAEDAPVRVGARTVIMENAVIRAWPQLPVSIGTDVMIGPGANVNGAEVDNDAFIAAGASLFPAACAGARRSKNSSSRFRFRPLYRGAFGFRLQPLGGASTYLRSVLDAGGLLHTRAEPAIGDFTDFRVGKAAAVGPSSLALAEKDAGGGIDEPPTRLLARKEGRGTDLGAPPVASRAPLIVLIASGSVR